jgi:phosphoribosylformylglycinamidine cyclo-ligase
VSKITYKSSGVDLDIYAESMSRLPRLLSSTFTSRVIRNDGGFAGLFKLNDDIKRYVDPVLVSCSDGVGTKLKIASMINCHNTVGIDLVAMSVNDAICCGAEPLFFLDYVAIPKDNPDLLESIVSGIVEGCRQSSCALLGGETAILPEMYKPDEYDLAGFCVGVVEREKIIDGKAIKKNDVLIGVESSGLHSNGFSLVRKIVFEKAGYYPSDKVPRELVQNDDFNQTIGNMLLTPTRIYVQMTHDLLANFSANDLIVGMAHITGGGLIENTSRIVPEGLSIKLNRNAWNIPPIFKWMQNIGEIDDSEMERVFNLGIGFVIIVRPEVADQIINAINFNSWKIGTIA